MTLTLLRIRQAAGTATQLKIAWLAAVQQNVVGFHSRHVEQVAEGAKTVTTGDLYEVGQRRGDEGGGLLGAAATVSRIGFGWYAF